MADYRLAWRRCKIWRNLNILALLGLFPVMEVVGFIARYFDVPALYSVFIVVWFIFILSTAAEFAWFRCPRCGKTFAVRVFFNLLPPVFVRRCVHCGLPKYSNG
jgi:hypothetical protein